MTTIQWGKARRGRHWHMLSAAGDPDTTHTLCGKQIELKEFLDGMPPRGGTPCPDCGDVCRDLTNTFRAALGQSDAMVNAPEETLDTDPDLA